MPTYTPERATINQQMQIGPEVSGAHGTPVAASKRIECFDWTLGINGDITDRGATGHKYDLVREEETEWVDLTVGGGFDYNGVTYLLTSVAGMTTPVAHGASVTAHDWNITPPAIGSTEPQTYTIQQGDSVRAHQAAYGLINSFGYTITRKSATITAKGISQPLQDNVTLTAAPTPIPLAPAIGKHFDIFLDPTSAALGTTALTKVLQVQYSFDSVYDLFWPLNRANAGFTAHVDTKPKTSIKIKLEADATGMTFLNYLQTGTTYFLRVQGQGPQIASDGPTNVYNTFQHDMAIKVGKPSAFADDSGVFAIEWDCNIVEDPSWGKAQTFLLTNLLSSL